MKKPAIIVVDNSPDTTGAFKAMLNACLELRNFFEFIFIIPSGSKNTDILTSHGFKVYHFTMVEISKRFIALIQYIPMLFVNAWRLCNIIKMNEVKIVHVNDIYNLIGVTARLWTKFKLFTHVRRMPDSFPRMLFKFWEKVHARFADHVICVSSAVSQQVNIHKKQVIYDHVIIDEKYSFKEIQEEAPVKLLYLANYTRGKGQEYAILAFREAQRKYPDITLKFAGGFLGLKKNEEFYHELLNRVEALELSRRISFDTFVSDVELEMKGADILLNFSESESFSFTCIEALAFGVPVICSVNGGPADYLVNKENGLLVENRNVSQMSEAIISLSTDIELRKKLAEKGKQTVKKILSKMNTTELLKKAYLEYTTHE